MFGSNNGETIDMLEKLYLILSRAMTAWLNFMAALFKE